MKKSRKDLLQEIKKELQNQGATAGEICTELLRIEKISLAGMIYYLEGLKNERIF